jgi:hypothetical protein
MAGLDLRLLQSGGLRVPPLCAELSGRGFDICYDGGERETLRADASYDCTKAGETLYLVVSPGAAYAIDTKKCAVTRVISRASTLSISTGVFGDAAAPHELTRDMDGNTVTWTLGAGITLEVTANYANGGVSLARAPELPEKSASDFIAVALGGGRYLQAALICGQGESLAATLIADFTQDICVGVIFGGVNRRFFGYATH